jgi:hypothetical protein
MPRERQRRSGEWSPLEFRQVLRRFGAETRDLPSVMAGLGVTEQEAHRALNRLYRAGYVRRDPARPAERCWRRTPAGAAVAQATVAPPLSRARAARLLQGVLRRVATINAKPYFLCRVTAVGVFGAYVTEAAVVDELDLVVNIAPKAPPPGTRDAVFRPDRILPYWTLRRRISSDDWSAWRERHVELTLAGGTPSIVLHRFDDPLLWGKRVRLVFLEAPTTAGSGPPA